MADPKRDRWLRRASRWAGPVLFAAALGGFLLWLTR